MFFVPLCAFSLSLLEGGANGIDDTAAHFAEVRAALRNLGKKRGGEIRAKTIKWNHMMCSDRMCCLFPPLSSFLLPSSPTPPLSNPILPAAMAPFVARAAVYRRRHTRLRTPAPWRSSWWVRWPGRTGRRADRRVSASRYRGIYGGSTRIYRTLGTRTPPTPA